MKYGVFCTYYGGSLDPRHADTLRQLGRGGVAITELHGSPYPEMARAEAARECLSRDLDVLVLLDQNFSAPTSSIEKLATLANETGGVVLPHDEETLDRPWKPYLPNALGFSAIHRSVFVRLAVHDEREYVNSAIDTGMSKGARPFFSPWNRDGSWLVPRVYAPDDVAFLHRVRAKGLSLNRCHVLHTVISRPAYFEERFNTNPRYGVPRYAVCVPSFGPLMHDQWNALYALERYGMCVLRVHNCPYIDLARSRLVSLALDVYGLDGVFFIDHDIVFRPEDVETLILKAEQEQHIIGAAYCMRKSAHAAIGAIQCEPGDEIKFFNNGGLYPALYVGMGFTAIPRKFFDELKPRLPELDGGFDHPVRPWFSLDVTGTFYCGEDVSFCNRVQALRVEQVGKEDWKVERKDERESSIFIDSTVRIFHRGIYDYGLEDVGTVVPRVGNLVFKSYGTKAEARESVVYASDLSDEMKTRHLAQHGFYNEA